MDLQLFVRTHRGLTLTESGESLYQDAKYIIQYAKDSVARAKNARQKTSNIIRIGTSPMTPGEFMVELWPKIHKYCPDIKFQLIPYENTPENAREILKNLGRNIDIVAGIFDDVLLRQRKCSALELSKTPIRVAVSIHHRLAQKDSLTIEDMYGEKLMLIGRGWNGNVDLLRDELCKHHPQIQIADFDFYNVDVFNQCENSNVLLMSIDSWKSVHPLLKIMPVEWKYSISFGILHSPKPSDIVQYFLAALQKTLKYSNYNF